MRAAGLIFVAFFCLSLALASLWAAVGIWRKSPPGRAAPDLLIAAVCLGGAVMLALEVALQLTGGAK